MSLSTCKIRLEIAKKANDTDEIKLWEERIAAKLTKDKYAKEKSESKTKSKEK